MAAAPVKAAMPCFAGAAVTAGACLGAAAGVILRSAARMASMFACICAPLSTAGAAGACVALCEKTNRELHELTDAEFLTIHPALTGGVREVLTVAGALSSRTTAGGTAPSEVVKQLDELARVNSDFVKLITSQGAAFSGMMSA